MNHLLSRLKNLLNRYDIKPNKLLGQNFLIDENILKKILTAAELKKTDTVLEVGPGGGILTFELAKRAGRVLAVEKDKNFVQILKEKFKDTKNVEIIQEDILSFLSRICHSRPCFRRGKLAGGNPARGKFQRESTPQLRGGSSLPAGRQARDDKNYSFTLQKNYKVVANIPYYLTSRLIKNLLESPHPPKKIILMVQKEVAQRICAAPPEMSILALAVQFYARPKIIARVSKNSFWPPPKVDSAILEIEPKKEKPEILPEKFFRLVHAGFSAPRKQIIGNLKKKLEVPKDEILEALKIAQVKPNQRAETLSLEDWSKIIQNLPKL